MPALVPAYSGSSESESHSDDAESMSDDEVYRGSTGLGGLRERIEAMAQIVMRLMASGPKGSLIYAEESKLTLLVLA